MRRRTAALGIALLALSPGCRVSAEAKASTNGEARAEASGESTETTSPPPAAPTTEAAPAPPPPPAPVEGACPVTCYVAQGANAIEVSQEEDAQLRGALGPVFARMNACTEGRGFKGALGSPTLNLRIAPDGQLAEIGVDPHHGWGQACMEDAARTAQPRVSLPGRTTVRCREHCPPPPRPARAPRTRAPKRAPAQPKAPAPAPAQPKAPAPAQPKAP